MAKKSPAKKTLRSFFSKSEANLKESVERDDDSGKGGEKKKFKLFKFKIKSKNASAPLKPVDENQVVSAAKPDGAAEDGDAWSDKRLSPYATAPRSKKDYSYSELDLRKPKKFGSFTFGFRKKKKRAEESLSQSTMGLHSSELKEPEEEPLDLSQWELEQANKRAKFTSQPELDSAQTFTIPSPPSEVANQSEPHIRPDDELETSVTLNNQSESQELLIDKSDPFDAGKEIRKAPIATIPELDLDWNEPIPSSEERHPTAQSEGPDRILYDLYETFDVTPPDFPPSPPPTVPNFPPSPPPTMLCASEDKATVPDPPLPSTVPVNGGFADAVVPEQEQTKADNPVAVISDVTSVGEPDVPEIVDSNTCSCDPSAVASDSDTDTVTESVPEAHTDTTEHNTDSPSPPRVTEASYSHTDESMPETVSGATRDATSSATAEHDTPSASASAVYGAMYESLFPQNFASEIFSASSNLGDTERIPLDTNATMTNSFPAVNKDLQPHAVGSDERASSFVAESVQEEDECATSHTETNDGVPTEMTAINSGTASSGPEMDTAEAPYTNLDANVTESEVTSTTKLSSTDSRPKSDVYKSLFQSLFPASFTSHQIDTIAETDSALPQTVIISTSTTFVKSESVGQDINATANCSQSETTLSFSDTRSDDFQLAQETVTLNPEVCHSVPPSSDFVRSPETDNQVTESRQTVAFVTDTDTDTPVMSADTGVESSGVPDTVTAVVEEMEDQPVEEETCEYQIDCYDMPYRPLHARVRSDDGSTLTEGSAMDIYYSAEEDNTEDSGEEEMYTVEDVEREELFNVDESEEAGLSAETAETLYRMEQAVTERGDAEWNVEAELESDSDKVAYGSEQAGLDGQTETEDKYEGQNTAVQEEEKGISVFQEDCDGMRQVEMEVSEATAAQPQMKEERAEEEGEKEGGEELLALPVRQVNALLECESAPPATELHGQGEGSEENLSTETHAGLATEARRDTHTQLAGQEEQYLEGQGPWSAENTHSASGDAESKDTVTHTSDGEKVDLNTFKCTEEIIVPTAEVEETGAISTEAIQANRNHTNGVIIKSITYTNGEVKHNTNAETVGIPESPAVTRREEVAIDTFTESAELEPDTIEIEHNSPVQRSSEGAGTIAHSTDKASTVAEQVADELSVTAAYTHHASTQDANAHSETADRPPATQARQPQGSLDDSAILRSAVEVSAPEIQQTKPDLESVDDMNPGYSTLSTTLSIKPTSPHYEGRDESRQRFHKVSLVTETDETVHSQDTVDFSGPSTTLTESNGADLESGGLPEYRWRNHYEGVVQFKPDFTEESLSASHSSVSYTYSSTSPTPSSSLPEASLYTQNLTTTSSPTSLSPGITRPLYDRLRYMREAYLSSESEVRGGGGEHEQRRSVREWEESAATAGERERLREAETETKSKSDWDSQPLPVTGFSSAPQTSDGDSLKLDDTDDSSFSGVFTATRVELVPDPTPPSSSPISPDPNSSYQNNKGDMETLVDTLKSMGVPQRQRSLRGAPPALFSSLPPIVEDASSPTVVPATVTSPIKSLPAPGAPADAPNGGYSLPPDLGLKWGNHKELRSPLTMMKQSLQGEPGNRGPTMPLRASAANSIVLRRGSLGSESSPEDSPSSPINGNGGFQSPSTSSRLENSFLFSSYRSASTDQPVENGRAHPQAHRSLFLTSSLPDAGPSHDRMSIGPRELGGLGAGNDSGGLSRYERFSFLLNSPSPSSLTGAEDPNSRMSRAPLSIGSPTSSNPPTRLLSPTGSIDLHRSFNTTDSPLSMFGQTQGMGMGMGMGMGLGMGLGAGTGALGTQVLQRSFSNEGPTGVPQSPLFNSVHGGSHFQSPEPEPEKIIPKYRAFPDAYLTKEKEHGKLNPRPGKMYIFDRPGMCGQRIEVRSDIIDATPWELQETISIRVVRGGWVLYEKPNFKGEKVALDEGDIELTYPFNPLEEEEPQQQQQKREQKENGEQKESGEQKENGEENSGQEGEPAKPARKFIIGSIRRAVRDYSVPEISLFPEENAEGKKVIFRDTSDDARIFGFPIKANSIIINAGLWLVYAQPFFQGVPRVLEVGGFSNPAAWGVEHPYVGSVHPLKIGEPKVEKPNEPQVVIYDKPYFTGKSRTIYINMKDFMTRMDRTQTAFMYSVGSLKVQGGIWVGYEKEGFRGHQYLLEEGEYHDWRVWGGCNSELRSVRVIRADLTEPLLVMYEQLEDELEEMEENTFEVTEPIADVELFDYKTNTRSIHVLNGAWVAYSHVDFSGDQYILEKGFYSNSADWGSDNNRICSIQPILMAPTESSSARNEVLLYTEPDFQGQCHVCDQNHETLSDKILTKSCRVVGGSWVLYDSKQYSGNLYVLSEGDYPNLNSMGCPPGCTIRSIKAVPLTLSVPTISLFGLECLEGREITVDTEIISMVEEGFNNHILSVRINSGCWVICEHSNYRGRQFLLEPIEITNWPKFSSLTTVGSMYPVRQKRRFFRIKNKERGLFLSIQGGVEELKTGRVVVTEQVEGMSDIWYYQDGLIKNKMSAAMSLQVMGNVEPGAKVVLWSETRQPIQTWSAEMKGSITNLTFPGVVLDVKGGKTYDKDHAVVMPVSEERPSQQWQLELL